MTITDLPDVDTDRVDWLAVEFVCNGTRMRLGKDKATLRAAVLRMPYSITMEETADRLGVITRRCQRILEDAGAEKCPSCRRLMLIPADRIVPLHLNGTGLRCRMGGFHMDDAARAAAIRRDRYAMTSFR